jgi:hypothetical protein
MLGKNTLACAATSQQEEEEPHLEAHITRREALCKKHTLDVLGSPCREGRRADETAFPLHFFRHTLAALVLHR